MERVGRSAQIEAQYRLLLKSAGAALVGGLVLAVALAKLLAGGAASVGAAAPPRLVFYPAFAMFFLVAVVLSRMGFLRVNAVRRGEMPLSFYRTFDRGEEPEPLRVVTRQFINLFEMPLLFHVVVIFAFITNQVTYLFVGLAWAYVLLRYVHTAIHLTSNHVPLRLSAYASSGLVLLVAWVTLLVQLLRAS